ncbi:MAG: DUF3179 domain-containing (seleno)protein [Gammaproteobacteria bacterium]
MWVGTILYLAGLACLLTTFLPFSPMTIDLVNLRRESQLAIHRHRRILWAGAGLSWGGAVLWGTLLTVDGNPAGPVLVWLTLGSATAMAVMFWSGYVPLVMTPPAAPRHLPGRSATLAPDAMVLGIALGEQACAYQRDQIARPHYFKDRLDERDLIVSYCILCNSATAFAAELNNRPLDLRCVTAFNNNIPIESDT